MCAIVGYSGLFDEELITKIFDNSKIRGLHAFGYAFYLDKQILNKKFLNYEDFIKSIIFDRPEKFIAHFRYSTSGDYQQIDNNQPLQMYNEAIAFNGVISQKKKSDMEAEYNLSLPADNDGYVLLQKLQDEVFLSRDDLTFAVVGLKDGKLYAVRNRHRPLWLHRRNGLVVFCSTEDIFRRSGIEEVEQIKSLKKIYAE